MSDAVDFVIASWRSSGVPLQVGLSAEAVVAAFAAMGRNVSSDVVALYEQCNGMREGESDGKHVFAFWPVVQVAREAERYDQKYIRFADFLLSSHEYCFHYESPDRSSVFLTGRSRDGTPERVANSVEEFFSLIAHAPEKAHLLLFSEPQGRKDFWSLFRR